MTISRIGDAGAGQGNPTTSITTGAISTQAGDLVFLFLKYEGGTTTATFSDSVGGGTNTFDTRATVNHSTASLHGVAASSVLAGGNASHTFTVTLGVSRDWLSLQIEVWRCTAGAWTYVGANSAQGTGTTYNAGSVSPAGAYAAMCGVAPYAGGTFTAGSGWTARRTSETGPGGAVSALLESRTNTSGETITGEATYTTSAEWCAAVVAFTENAGGGDPEGGLIGGKLMRGGMLTRGGILIGR